MSEVRRVGIIMHDNPFNDPTIRGMAQFTRARGHWKLLLETPAQCAPSQLQRAALDGAIVGLAKHSRMLRAIRRLGIPVVDILPESSLHRFPQILPDDRAVGRSVAQHFLQRGYRRFVCCRYSQAFDADWSDLRAEGFTQAIEDAGFEVQCHQPDPQANWRNLSSASRMSKLGQWLRRIETPAALFAVNDVRAEHVLVVCESAGLRVPEDIAVVGVDNAMPLCELLDPPLSSVPLDQVRAGYQAAELLDNLMSGGRAPKEPILVPPLSVVVRRSSDQFAVEDPELSQALRFIWDHATERLEVGRVVESVAISRRSLEMKFRKFLGRSAADEIWRVRVERAKALLRDASLPIRVVGLRSGFRHAAHFSILFRRRTGMTPMQFRQQSQ